ncbi:uncharacterized protein [Branchiostoma lanceolatum]|uniref:uncharacterized protein n=1 Tax=Branchiostoma lanceolatum TaxID=7740 RepID=UPI003452E45A
MGIPHPPEIYRTSRVYEREVHRARIVLLETCTAKLFKDMMKWSKQARISMCWWILLGIGVFILPAESVHGDDVDTTTIKMEGQEPDNVLLFPSSFTPATGMEPMPTFGIAILDKMTKPRAFMPGTANPGDGGKDESVSVEAVTIPTCLGVFVLLLMVGLLAMKRYGGTRTNKHQSLEEVIEFKRTPDGKRRLAVPDQIVNSTFQPRSTSESSLEVSVDCTSPLMAATDENNLAVADHAVDSTSLPKNTSELSIEVDCTAPLMANADKNNLLHNDGLSTWSKDGSQPNSLNLWPALPTDTAPVTFQKMTPSTLYIHQFSRHFDHDGGKLAFPKLSDVEVIIPRGAIPKNINGKLEVEARVVKPEVNLNLAAAVVEQKRCTEHELQLSPAVEILAEGMLKFDKPVTIRIPHRACIDKADWSPRVQCSESQVGSQMKWKDIPPESKDNNSAVVDCCYTYDASYVYIKTTHFTTYVVTGCCKKRKPLDLQCVVFGQYVERGEEQEVIFRVYLCDTIVDHRQSLESDEGQSGGREVCIPRPLSLADGKSDIVVTLLDDVKRSQPPNWPWTVDSLHGRQTSQQSIKVQSCIKCIKCSPARRAPFAQFICKPTDPTVRQSHIVASFDVKQDVMRTSRRKKTEVDDIASLIMSVRDFELAKQRGKTATCRPLQERDLAKVAELIPRKELNPLARHLDLTDVEIQVIERDHQNDAKEQTNQVLLAWRRKEGSNATLDKLLTSLRSCGLNNVADDVSQMHASEYVSVA